MTTTTVNVRAAQRFHALHHEGAPLRLVNAWDALSARVAELAGANAIGTSSFAAALARGYADGERIPWPEALGVVAEVAHAVGIPVTADVEAGRGASPEAVAVTVEDVLEAGAVGVNLEDSRPDAPGSLFDVDAQCDRLAAARRRADDVGVPMFLNARCDVYFGAVVEPETRLATALERAQRYVDVGADGVFLPGLIDREEIETVVSALPVPLNVMLWPGLPSTADLTAAGVRRISQGGAGFLLAVAHLDRTTRTYLADDADAPSADAPLEPAFHLLGDLAFRGQ